MAKVKSEGKCLFCEKTFSKLSINKHLSKHLTDRIPEGLSGSSFLVKIVPDPKYYGSSVYFLYLWVDGKAKMDHIDSFLRDIWLECCDHLSSFTDTEMLQQSSNKNKFNDNDPDVPMSRKVKDVFYEGYTLKYDYDFGSTTSLILTVAQEFPMRADSKVVLLSRNEPLELFCKVCGKEPAVELCTVHSWEENTMFCKKCAKKHAKTCEEFSEYGRMSVVNSPRMGVCAYDGGLIDIERDRYLGIK